MKKLPLTIVTAVLNEEKNLPSFLRQIVDFADEIIIVVDSQTVDKSADVAGKHECKVLLDKGESKGIVFNNKNRGAREAKNDWVLILDADERMDSTLREEITSIVSGVYKQKADIYQTGFLNYEFGKFFLNSDQKDKPFVRLFRKGSFAYQTDSTAEGFGIQTTSLASEAWYSPILLRIPKVRSWYLNKLRGIVTLGGHLIHLSHPTIDDFVRKINLYSTREARILFDKNPNRSELNLLTMIVFAPIKEFFYKYFIWQLFKEGIHGYIVSVLFAHYHFLIYAKYFGYIYKKKHFKEISDIGKKFDFEDL